MELASNVEGNTDQEDDQEDIGEAVTTSRVCWKGSILDGRILVLQLRSVRGNQRGHVQAFRVRTDVVLTPQSSGAGDAGAGGVSMNSKSSEDSEWVLTMFSQSIECLFLRTVCDETKSEKIFWQKRAGCVWESNNRLGGSL